MASITGPYANKYAFADRVGHKTMLSNYRSGLKRWSSRLQEIWADPKLAGIEKWARRFLYFSRILSISEHLSFFVIGAKTSKEQTDVIYGSLTCTLWEIP